MSLRSKPESLLWKRMEAVEGALLLRRVLGRMDPDVAKEWDGLARRSSGFAKAILPSETTDDLNDRNDKTAE